MKSIIALLKLQYPATVEDSKGLEVGKLYRSSTHGGGYMTKVTNYDPTYGADHPTSYIVKITGVKPDLTDNEDGLKLSCSCPKFKFYHEYALHFHGYADIVFSNGEPPVQKNPQYKRKVQGCQTCKHLVAFANYLLSR